MSKVSAIYHIVFATRGREMTVTEKYDEVLYSFIWNLLKERGCILYRIGGIANHIHMLINLNPNMALAALMRDIKSQSSAFLQKDSRFPHFAGWGKEYFAATLAFQDRDKVIEYIKGQKIHHGVELFDNEITKLCSVSGMQLYCDDLK